MSRGYRPSSDLQATFSAYHGSLMFVCKTCSIVLLSKCDSYDNNSGPRPNHRKQKRFLNKGIEKFIS